ncbi:MAG TPA: ABC transporter permease [Gemmatimonadaceae bacterium]|jgi:predicted permease
MSNLTADLRLSVRALRAKPGFTIVALLSLTLGIGANTTIFSVANGALLSELPVPHPEQLVRLVQGRHSPPQYEELRHVRTRATTVDAVIGERLISGAMTTDDGRTERFDGALVTGDFFRGLQLRPALGRFFERRDDGPSAEGPVLVLSHQFWRTRLGGDSSIIGKRIRLNERPFTVIGVAPAGFTSSTWGWHPSAWMPLSEHEPFFREPLGDWNGSMYVTLRLKPGIPATRASAEMDALAAQLRQTDSVRYARFNFRVLTARGINEEPRQAATVMTGALLALASVVLLIACANVANLQLARATGRRQEIAIRLALGASRARLVQQLLLESFVLSACAAGLGLLVAFGLTRVAARAVPADLPNIATFSPDLRVAAFAALLAVLTGLAFGLVPALRSTRPDLVQSIKEDVAIQGLKRSPLRSTLLVTQVAMGLVLLASAALFVRGLSNARSMDPGFRDSGVVNLRVDLRPRNYDEARGIAVHRELLERARTLPGVTSATLSSVILLEGNNVETTVQRADDRSTDPARMMQVSLNGVWSSYFETMSIPLVAGRPMTDAEVASKAPVAVISAAMAQRLWPDQSALGRTFRLSGQTSPVFEVIGVSRAVKYFMIGDEARPIAFLPASLAYEPDLALQVKSSAPLSVIGPRLEALARELEPSLPPMRAKAMRDDMWIAYLPARIGAVLFGSFGALALFIAMAGIYGVTSYIVAQRTRELGVRAALGAQSRNLIGVGLRDTMRLVALGVGIGLPLSYGVVRGLTSLPLLYRTPATDPFVLSGATVALALVAAIAAYLPARRAGRIDPIISLRAR